MKFKQYVFHDAMDRAEAVLYYRPIAKYAKYRPTKQFRHMNASETDWFPYMLGDTQVMVKALKSYNTIVAICISSPCDTMITFVDWHGYSTTTSKQVTVWYGEIRKWVESLREKEGIMRITFGADWGL